MKDNVFLDIPTELEIDTPSDNIEMLEIESLDSTSDNLENKVDAENLNGVQERVKETNENLNSKNISLEQQEPVIESIDGNPDVLDIEVKNLEPEKPKKKKTFKYILIVFIILLVSGTIIYAYYKFVQNRKPVETTKELNLEVNKLNHIESFEKAYNIKTATLSTKSESEKNIYEISNGSVKMKNESSEIYLSVPETRLTAVSYLTFHEEKEVIALKDSDDNYYFAHIDTTKKEDVVLNYENNKLFKIEKKENVSNLAVGTYLNKTAIFYIAIKNGQNYFVNVVDGIVHDISSINTYIYNGINIDISDLSISEKAKTKVDINGVGLFYDGSLYIYKGAIKDLEEFEVKYDEESLEIETMFIAYNSELEFFDLYVLTYNKDLFKINLLKTDILNKKVDIKKYESKISEYTIFDEDINSVDIVFENGKTIKLK